MTASCPAAGAVAARHRSSCSCVSGPDLDQALLVPKHTRPDLDILGKLMPFLPPHLPCQGSLQHMKLFVSPAAMHALLIDQGAPRLELTLWRIRWDVAHDVKY